MAVSRLVLSLCVCALVSVHNTRAYGASPAEICLYQDAAGEMHQVTGKDRIPSSFRDGSKCFSPKQGTYLASPSEIDLKGTVRREDMNSAVGRIELRWPRKVESLFGRTPQRAVADAALAVSRALKSAGFPPKLQTLDLDWHVVFMDEDVPETQIPTYLVNNCHPAWMTPPANIYVVAQRVAAGCGGGRSVRTSVADSQLATVLIHEMGHAVEFQLLEGAGDSDSMRAEGFASWFEQFGADFSAVIPRGSIRQFYSMGARSSLKQSPKGFDFQGSFEDYARASLFFRAIEERRGVRGIVEVYQTMKSERLSLLAAIAKRMGWDVERLQAEMARAAG